MSPLLNHCAFGFVLLMAATVVPGQEPIALDSEWQLFVDYRLIESMDGAELRLHRPEYAGVALEFDAPWEGKFSGYVTVLHDGAIYRMYYRGMPEAGGDGSELEVTCYAESPNGRNWVKPSLGLFEVMGTRDNNVILADSPPFTHNFAPFHDRNPQAADDETFKALAGTARGEPDRDIKGGLHAFASSDGIHWERLHDEPVITEGAFDSQNVSFYSETEGQYVCYFRTWDEGGFKGYRSISRSTSEDFIHWTEPVPMTYGDTPREHLYTNQTQPYFRAPSLYVAFPMRFMPGRRVLTPEQAAQLGVHVSDSGPSYASDVADTVFMTTRGGSAYDRTFMEAFIRPGTDLGNWASRAGMAAYGVVQTGDAELSVYKQFHYAQPSAYLGRYRLRLDGFASVNAPYEGGTFHTKPVVFEGTELVLNFATSAAGAISVEIQTAGGDPIDGYRRDQCLPVIGDMTDRVVHWEDGSDISELAGTPVRLKFEMKDCDLYALKFR